MRSVEITQPITTRTREPTSRPRSMLPAVATTLALLALLLAVATIWLALLARQGAASAPASAW